MRVIRLVLLCALISACNASSKLACGPAQKPAVSEHLYLGRSTPDGSVTDQHWSDFLRDVVSIKFPNGFTIWDAAGQWRSTDGGLLKEQTFVFNVIYFEQDQGQAAVTAIAQAYAARFKQESVLRTTQQVCASF